jgi:2-methylisocitrate lyase-like PEP mutase family enzyme
MRTLKIDPPRQRELARQFKALHHSGQTLILANAWDCISAKIFEQAGFPAIATTSSGISFSCGYQDGEHMDPAVLLEVLARITRTVQVPVTADIEAGYAQGDEKKFREFIRSLVRIGVVGINLEDADAHQSPPQLKPLEHALDFIRIAREAAQQEGGQLFINARTDALRLGAGDLEARLGVAIERASAFAGAGADGIFVPFVRDISAVTALKEAISLPLNILMDESLDVKALKQLGIARISTGSKPILATLALLQRIGDALLHGDDWQPLYTAEPTYAAVNAMLA